MANQATVTQAAQAATPAATVTALPPQPGKCGKVPAGNLYKLGNYNPHTSVNAVAWQAVQACIQANGGKATAQQIANALAACPNITSNAMLAYLLKPAKLGAALLPA
jgi:hypothetical protein